MTNPAKKLYIGFNWFIDAQAVSRLLAHLSQAQAEGVTEITLVLNSTGGASEQAIYAGSIVAGFPIPITTFATGMVQSAAALIFLNGHRRFATREAGFMFHPATITYTGTTLNATQLASSQAGVRQIDDANRRLLALRSGKQLSDVEPLFIGDRIFDAQFGKNFGFVDEVLPLQIPSDAAFVQVLLDSQKA